MMKKTNYFEDILIEVCADPRIKNGIFSFYDAGHVEVLLEEVLKLNISKDDAILSINSITEGKYPDRQAYNKDGLLVTFPSPEYKQRAISRGTHFEQNPKTLQANIFDTPGAQPAAPTPTPAPAAQDSAPVAPQPDASAPTPAPVAPEIPTTAPAPVSKEPNQPAINPQDRTPEEVKVDSKAVEKMLALELSIPEALEYGLKNENGQWYLPNGKHIRTVRYYTKS